MTEPRDRCDAARVERRRGLHPETAGGRAPGALQGRPALSCARSQSYVHRGHVRYCLTEQQRRYDTDYGNPPLERPSVWSEPGRVSLNRDGVRVCDLQTLLVLGSLSMGDQTQKTNYG